MVKILQINNGRSRESHDINFAAVKEEDIGIIISSEPNKKLAMGNSWFTDENIDATIKVMDPNIKVYNSGKGRGYAWIETDRVIIYSCYVHEEVQQAELVRR